MEVDVPVVKRRVVPWVEKYRPATVDEVAHQDEVVRTLKMSIEQGNLPHLLFHGPPGDVLNFVVILCSQTYFPLDTSCRHRQDDNNIGCCASFIRPGPLSCKNSWAKCFRRQRDKRCKRENQNICSRSCGGAANQVLIFEFYMHLSILKLKSPFFSIVRSGYPCPRFKLIILDEADTMTPEAQSALRRIMEAQIEFLCHVCHPILSYFVHSGIFKSYSILPHLQLCYTSDRATRQPLL